jgi:hypothetical protein
MDFAKFVSLISREELYFCNLEVLAKSDPHEGLLSQPNYRHRQWRNISDLAPEEHKAIFGNGMSGEQERIQFESQRNSREYWLHLRFYDRRTLLVNCWHVNRYESAAMWTQYVTGGQGIAITSSYTRIVDALTSAPQRVFLGIVKYLDWTTSQSTIGRWTSDVIRDDVFRAAVAVEGEAIEIFSHRGKVIVVDRTGRRRRRSRAAPESFPDQPRRQSAHWRPLRDPCGRFGQGGHR